MKEETTSLITIIIIAMVISIGLVSVCLIESIAEADALRVSERAAWEQVHELRSTMAAQRMSELF